MKYISRDEMNHSILDRDCHVKHFFHFIENFYLIMKTFKPIISIAP